MEEDNNENEVTVLSMRLSLQGENFGNVRFQYSDLKVAIIRIAMGANYWFKEVWRFWKK